jgi:hypothetical protein
LPREFGKKEQMMERAIFWPLGANSSKPGLSVYFLRIF